MVRGNINILFCFYFFSFFLCHCHDSVMGLQEGLFPKLVPALQLPLAPSGSSHSYSQTCTGTGVNKAGIWLWLNYPWANWWAAARWVSWFASMSSCTNTHTGTRKGSPAPFPAVCPYFPWDLGEDSATFFHSPAEAAKRVMGGTKEEDSISLLLIVPWREQTAKVLQMLWVYNF